ncbi:MAG TPA: lysylphosphatidylglycerol synthase transmembrane domain-containing protein [Bryobacteraceae bacterium]|nr:lysylphosphatidylglycerol synthase transmembrane domain-containing protein [Bryobacteraceae bacterium]
MVEPSPAIPASGITRPPPAPKTGLWLLLSAAALIAGVLLARLFLARRGFDWRAFGATLLALQWWWLAAAAGGVFAGYYGRALRWRVLMRPVKPQPSLWNLFSATVIGFSAITLLGRPGEFVRPCLIAAKEKVSTSSQMAALLLERIYDVLIVLAIFGFALGHVHRSDARLGPALAWVFATGGWFVAILSIVVLGLLIAFRNFSAAMRRRLLDALAFLPDRHFKRADRLVTAFVQGAESTKSHRSVLLLVGYTVFEWATITLTVYCVMRAFGHALHFGWLDILIFLGFLAFGAVVQIPGVGGGMQVISILVLTQIFRIPLEISTSVAIILWVVSFVVVVPIGLVFALREGIQWRSLRPWEPEVSL